MRLSRLTIYGFKSFADKIELRFGSGMTAVVGPNGCGKTNVVDAIKWVMGEQKPTAIRGSSMEDVIFNGSSSRKPLGFAEVQLTIEDTENVLPVDVPEITIARRLFRSGESEYLMNRQQCRLRDIQDLFMDSGIANNSYSVIQQEMVDVIISDKADERRNLFEEAAGIQKYKSRRRETQNKLRSTEQDLLRLTDVITEVEKTVRSLKRQVNRAKRYQRYRERLSVAEVHLAFRKDRRFEEEMLPLREEMRTLRDSPEGSGSGLAQHEAAVAEARARQVDQEKVLAEKQREVDAAREAVREVEGELIALRERRTAQADSAERGRSEALEMDERRQSALTEKDRLSGELEEARTEQTRLESEEAGITVRLEEIEERLKEARGELGELQGRHLRASNYYQDEAQRAEFLQFKVAERRKRNEGLRGQEKEAREGAARAADDLRSLQNDLESATRDRQRRLEARRDAEEAREATFEELQTRVRAAAEREGSLRAAVVERDVVRDLVERLEGVEDAVRDLRHDESVGAGPLLAEALAVPADALAAVEAALGPALEGLMVADRATLTRALERLLARPEGGRAVLLAGYLDAGRPPVTPVWAEGARGVRGPLSARVEGERDEARVARGLLARTLWVEDMETGFDLAGAAGEAGWVVVTDAGETIQPGGFVSAGRPATGQADGLLARRARLDVLEDRVEEARAAHAESEGESEEARAGMDAARLAASRAVEHLEAADRREAEIERGMQATRSRHDGLLERADDLHLRIADEEEELSADTTELEKLSPLLSEALEESGQLGGAMESQRARVEGVLSQREECRFEHQEHRLNRVRADHRIENFQREIARLGESATQLEEAAGRRRADVAASEKNVEELAGGIGEKETLLEERRGVRAGLEEALAGLEREHLEHRNSLQEAEEVLRQERKARENQQERIHSVELRLSELGMRRENLAERIREEYDVALDEVEEETLLGEGGTPSSYEDLEEEVRTLRERLDQIGPVNLLALEEYETENERFEFLSAQKADLEAAKATLEQTIRKINKTARQRFVETFEAMRHNFRRTYEQFFEGGEADVFLADDGDPLESRIEIVARPKGKILKSMAALSGGEKALTAVALLFAIYLVKPSPFCILDEVDAPLDDANIGRFLKVIQSFEETTQFILITHNKRTMEASDAFLGITMEEAGVSKVVGVRFEEEAAA